VFLRRHDYETYAAQNVQLYLDLTRTPPASQVMALPSGFLTYPAGVHPDYSDVEHEIAASPFTAVLLPSFDFEACVAETVRRQVRRPFGRRAAREEEVIRARFGLYRALVAPQFKTMQGIDAVVVGLLMLFASRRVTPQRPVRD
jgi:shikimate kinase